MSASTVRRTCELRGSWTRVRRYGHDVLREQLLTYVKTQFTADRRAATCWSEGRGGLNAA
jgi:hypothetical protein